MRCSDRVNAASHRAALAAFAVAGVFTALVLAVPHLHLAYQSPDFHLVFETTTALVVLLSAYLVLGRFAQTRFTSDLALAYPLLLLALTNVGIYAIMADSAAEDAVRSWTAVTCRLISAVVLAAAAFAPRQRVRRPEGAALFITAAAVATFSVSAAVFTALRDRLPPVIDVGVARFSDGRPHIEGHEAMLSAQLVTVVLCLVAAFGFTRAMRSLADPFLGWLAAGSVFAGFASLHYFLYPSLYSNWVYSGDFLRLGFFVLLGLGAAQEIRSHWRSRYQAAVLEERRRLARDLHDGLAQELAYIASHAQELSDDTGRADARNIARASERAVDEARRAIAVLTQPLDRSFASLLSEVASVAGSRVGVRVDVRADDDVVVPSDIRDDLLRIASEAVTNAGRHGHAQEVSIAIRNGHGTVLRVEDGGVGFDVAAGDGGGFGLESMRERAEAHAGVFNVWSAPGSGTVVEVRIP